MSKKPPETIDQPENMEHAHDNYRNMIRWWEKKRWWYNLIMLAWICFFNYNYWNYPLRSILGTEVVLLENFYLLITCNICYTAGWGLEVLLHYFLKTGVFHGVFRWTLLILGIMFSLLMTLVYIELLLDVFFI